MLFRFLVVPLYIHIVFADVLYKTMIGSFMMKYVYVGIVSAGPS